MTRRTYVLIGAFAIAMSHFALSAFFAAATPYRESGRLLNQGGAPAQDIGAPDERQHANYVQRLLEGQGFPVFDPHSPDLYETYQSHQPPAYYVLAAGWAKATGVTDVADPSSGMRLRLLSALIGAIGILGVFSLARTITESDALALAAAAIAAWLPMLAALDGSVSNDSLLIALCSWSLALFAQGAVKGWTVARAVGAGVLVGAALLTKTTAVALLIPFAVAVLATRPRPAWGVVAAGAAACLLVPLPWWIRNTTLYGDPLAIRAFGDAFTGTAQAKTFIEAFGVGGYWIDWVGWWTARSFVGTFGYMDIFLPSPVYAAVLLAFAAGLVVWFARFLRDREASSQRTAQIVNLLFALFVLAFFLRFNAQYFQGQGRYLMPAVAAFAVALASGLCVMMRGKPQLAAFLAAGLLVTSLYALSILPAEFQRRLDAPQRNPVSAFRQEEGFQTLKGAPGNPSPVPLSPQGGEGFLDSGWERIAVRPA